MRGRKTTKRPESRSFCMKGLNKPGAGQLGTGAVKTASVSSGSGSWRGQVEERLTHLNNRTKRRHTVKKL